jgi:hypothetical protein
MRAILCLATSALVLAGAAAPSTPLRSSPYMPSGTDAEIYGMNADGTD